MKLHSAMCRITFVFGLWISANCVQVNAIHQPFLDFVEYSDSVLTATVGTVTFNGPNSWTWSPPLNTSLFDGYTFSPVSNWVIVGGDDAQWAEPDPNATTVDLIRLQGDTVSIRSDVAPLPGLEILPTGTHNDILSPSLALKSVSTGQTIGIAYRLTDRSVVSGPTAVPDSGSTFALAALAGAALLFSGTARRAGR